MINPVSAEIISGFLIIIIDDFLKKAPEVLACEKEEDSITSIEMLVRMMD